MDWRRLTYGQAMTAVRAVAQALLERGVSAERPVLILSGNGIEHALLGLACLHVGVPYAPISPAYSLVSTDLKRLREIVALATPGLVFASGAAYGRALDAVVLPGVEIVGDGTRGATPFATLLRTTGTTFVDAAAARVGGDTLAKLLFTSGSTGAPKAVITTHGMLCSNQAMIGSVFEFLADEPPVLLDWLPWSHAFGGNHNFNLVLFNGGTLFIDPSRPVPGQFGPTMQALREVAPTMHLAVPKAWEELAGQLHADPALNVKFHSRLRVPFYAAASLSQAVWDDLARLSRQATGRVVPMITGLGSTETAPMAICSDGSDGRAGHIGCPVAGVQLKLAPVGDKLEVRISGPNVTPGYWRDPGRTAAAFDDEGFYRMGDALAWVDPNRPGRGLRFDGRLAEDFKLNSGTWVSVDPLRARLIAAMAPDIREIVVAGHDRDAIAVLAIPFDPAAATDPDVRARIGAMLTRLAAEAGGTAARVTRLAFLTAAFDRRGRSDRQGLRQPGGRITVPGGRRGSALCQSAAAARAGRANPDGAGRLMFMHPRNVTIEWGDCDPAGIVFYPRYFAMFDASTAALFAAATGMTKRQMLRHYAVVGFPMVDTRASFHVPGRFGDVIRIETTVGVLRRSSFDVAHRIMRGDTLAAEGFETRVWAGPHPDDPDRIKSVPLPAELAARLADGPKQQ